MGDGDGCGHDHQLPVPGRAPPATSTGRRSTRWWPRSPTPWQPTWLLVSAGFDAHRRDPDHRPGPDRRRLRRHHPGAGPAGRRRAARSSSSRAATTSQGLADSAGATAGRRCAASGYRPEAPTSGGPGARTWSTRCVARRRRQAGARRLEPVIPERLRADPGRDAARWPSASPPPATGSTWSAASCATCCVGRRARPTTPTSTSPPTPARPRSSDCVAGWADAVWTQGERFGTIGVHARTAATSRSPPTGPRPTRPTRASPTVVFADAIEADLSRRDFTVNAMALRLADRRRSRADRPVRRRGRPGRPGGCARRCRPRSPSATIRCACCGPPGSSPATASSPTPELVDAVRDHGATASRSCRPSGSATSSTS